MNTVDIAILVAKTLLFYLIVLHVVPIMVWVERRGAALIQDRPGPNRVGPFGLLQPVADFVKFIFKEDPIPTGANRGLFLVAPALILIPASLTLAVLPFADKVKLFGREILLQVADLDIAILYVLAIGSLGIYGILFGGWASGNKFSLMGALRASSQVISYEIPLGLAAVGAVAVYGTFSLREIALAQDGLWFGWLPRWGIFLQPVGFWLFFIASFAETNRLPFDLPETEAELVAGYHTEYGSMKFGMFMMAEYMNLTTISGVMVTLFFGGWHLPFVADAMLLKWIGSQNLLGLVQVVIFLTKVAIFLCVFVWVRWTVPRFRFDQLMRITWGRLIPLGIVNLLVTAGVMLWLGGWK
ncbi:MAG: NADH-quinone oxidoreductase subunit NuoH [Deltaproteobacteria bacterium]|nr:NADH-quinone oxidoreductase subunit NuoH [Deltaproteobacteria bacterium]